MEDAEYYQAHKDEEEEREVEAEPLPRPERRRLASMVSVRFSPEEVHRVRAAAEALEMSLSGFVRQAALEAASPGAPSEQRRLLVGSVTRTSGGPVGAQPGSDPKLYAISATQTRTA